MTIVHHVTKRSIKTKQSIIKTVLMNALGAIASYIASVWMMMEQVVQNAMMITKVWERHPIAMARATMPVAQNNATGVRLRKRVLNQPWGVCMKSISRIEIEFQAPVDLPKDWDRRLHDMIQEVCDQYKREHPGRTMWPFGWGSKPIWNEPNEPTFNDSVLHIEVAERKAHQKRG